MTYAFLPSVFDLVIPNCNHNYMSTAQEAAVADTAGQIRAWFLGRLPDGWFTGEPEVIVDREEITVTGELPAVRGTAQEGAEAGAEGSTDAEAMAAGRSRRFRAETRDARIGIAREAEMRFGRKV